MGEFATINGSRLYYESAGRGEPVLLIHGFTLDTRMWDDQVPALKDHYRVVRYDMRGFGQSELPGPSVYSQVDDLAGLMDAIGLDKAHLVGQSRGGAVAIDFALTHPDRVDRLILIDTVLGGFQWSPEQAARDGQVWEEAGRGGVEAARQSWLTHPLFAPALANPAVAERLRRIVDSYSGWHFVNANPEVYLDPPAAGRLAELKGPTLVIIGELDLPDFRRISDQVATQAPAARQVRITNAGHMSNMESPVQVNRAISEFLGSS